MAIVIVFTIYKNGGNAGVLGASFSCAVFGVRCGSCGNAGASYAGVNAGRSVVLAVLNEDAGALDRWIGTD